MTYPLFNEQDARLLETLVNVYSLEQVLDQLANICFEKSSHMESAWQDANGAKLWDRAGCAVRTLAAHNAIAKV